jgi:hypothetical protein
VERRSLDSAPIWPEVLDIAIDLRHSPSAISIGFPRGYGSASLALPPIWSGHPAWRSAPRCRESASSRSSRSPRVSSTGQPRQWVRSQSHGQDPEVAERSVNPRPMQAISSLLQGSASLRPDVEPPPRPPLRRTRIARPWERFTDRARRVLVLAQDEARLLNHSFIGTEHVLLGLTQGGSIRPLPPRTRPLRLVRRVLGVWIRRCPMRMPALST